MSTEMDGVTINGYTYGPNRDVTEAPASEEIHRARIALADADAAGMMLVRENERLRTELARVTAERDTAIERSAERLVENKRQAEEIAARDEVVKAVRQMIELGAIDRYQPESYRLVVALARLDTAPTEAE